MKVHWCIQLRYYFLDGHEKGGKMTEVSKYA